jgi:hypothetical protein
MLKNDSAAPVKNGVLPEYSFCQNEGLVFRPANLAHLKVRTTNTSV